MPDPDLIRRLAAALLVEVEACELRGDRSAHHAHCRQLIEEANRAVTVT